VEHVREELDAPREFYFDAAAQRLYYFHNDTAGTPPPAGWTWEVPLLRTLVNISGGAADITIQGLTFTGAAATFLAPHGIPVRGGRGVARARGMLPLLTSLSLLSLSLSLRRAAATGAWRARAQSSLPTQSAC